LECGLELSGGRAALEAHVQAGIRNKKHSFFLFSANDLPVNILFVSLVEGFIFCTHQHSVPDILKLVASQKPNKDGSLSQCCGSGMFFPDPKIFSSRISDTGTYILHQNGMKN
jgi:hypothetical protein